MPAQFILSFDCEGKWGVGDHLTARHRRELRDERLRAAYSSILDLLDEYRIEATFAFVGAFAQSAQAFERIRGAIEPLNLAAPGYIAPALRDLDESGGSGWHGGHLVDLVTSAVVPHEIALHGVTHVPWTTVSAATAQAEMRIFAELEGPVGKSRTFVYPRNLIAHTELLSDHGFAGFRSAPAHQSRVMSLISEFNMLEPPQRALRSKGIVRIPGGFFLNWRHGARRLVPVDVTRMRVLHLLDAASTTDRIVHYWLHPENIATAPGTLELLRMLLHEVANAREAGRCQVATQLGYCRGAGLLP